jgi:hypothetical protein
MLQGNSNKITYILFLSMRILLTKIHCMVPLDILCKKQSSFRSLCSLTLGKCVVTLWNDSSTVFLQHVAWGAGSCIF